MKVVLWPTLWSWSTTWEPLIQLIWTSVCRMSVWSLSGKIKAFLFWMFKNDCVWSLLWQCNRDNRSLTCEAAVVNRAALTVTGFSLRYKHVLNVSAATPHRTHLHRTISDALSCTNGDSRTFHLRSCTNLWLSSNIPVMTLRISGAHLWWSRSWIVF